MSMQKGTTRAFIIIGFRETHGFKNHEVVASFATSSIESARHEMHKVRNELKGKGFHHFRVYEDKGWDVAF